jgi:hypothetical protein
MFGFGLRRKLKETRAALATAMVERDVYLEQRDIALATLSTALKSASSICTVELARSVKRQQQGEAAVSCSVP